MWHYPTIQDILKARSIISCYLPRTPLYPSPVLSRLIGADIYVKYENHQPVGSFKVRGGINRISQMSDDERSRGMLTVSTGNHGQSIAYASRLFGVRARIVVPERSNPDKVTAMRDLGAEIIFHGKDFDEARIYGEGLSSEKGYTFIDSGNELPLIAGVGTVGIEIIENLPDVEVIIVPVGGGSSAAGNSIVARAINPAIEVIAVQSEGANCVYLSWKTGEIVRTQEAATFAEGLATRVPFALPLSIMRDNIREFILVSDEEIKRAILILFRAIHNIAEGAGASPLAAALKIKDRLKGRKVVLILSGGNLTLETLHSIMNNPQLTEGILGEF
jgi:threonine dehydratase